MTRNYFEELMAGFGAHSAEGTAFGSREGFLYSAAFTKGPPDEILFRFAVGGPVKQVVRELQEKQNVHITWYAESDPGSHDGHGGVLVALAEPPSDFYAKATVHTLLGGAVAALAAAGLRPDETCTLCALGRCDTAALLEYSYRNTHKACVETRLELPEEDRMPAKAKTQGHVLTGILGALLGAFVAALPNWSQALNQYKLSPVLYALIPVVSALLYRVFRGKPNKVVSLVTVLGASFAAAFALELVWNWIVLTNQSGQNLAFAETMARYFASNTVVSALREMLFSLVFLVVGFFPGSVLLRRYFEENDKPPEIVRGAAYVRATMPPPPEEEGGPGLLEDASEKGNDTDGVEE